MENSVPKPPQMDPLDMATHQLRTPLTRNKWSLNFLIHDSTSSFSADDRELLRKIYDDNERAINMITDMLRADRETIASDRDLIKVNVAELIEKTINEIRPDALGKNITLQFSPTKDIVLPILADPKKLNYVFENLFLNAIRYTPQGGAIIVQAHQKNNAVIVSVKDNGIGIPEEEKNHIFGKFYRAANARKVESEGTGLGLFIIKHILEQLGGKIWFESEENKGTTFWLSLPSIGMI